MKASVAKAAASRVDELAPVEFPEHMREPAGGMKYHGARVFFLIDELQKDGDFVAHVSPQTQFSLALNQTIGQHVVAQTRLAATQDTGSGPGAALQKFASASDQASSALSTASDMAQLLDATSSAAPYLAMASQAVSGVSTATQAAVQAADIGASAVGVLGSVASAVPVAGALISLVGSVISSIAGRSAEIRRENIAKAQGFFDQYRQSCVDARVPALPVRQGGSVTAADIFVPVENFRDGFSAYEGKISDLGKALRVLTGDLGPDLVNTSEPRFLAYGIQPNAEDAYRADRQAVQFMAKFKDSWSSWAQRPIHGVTPLEDRVKILLSRWVSSRPILHNTLVNSGGGQRKAPWDLRYILQYESQPGEPQWLMYYDELFDPKIDRVPTQYELENPKAQLLYGWKGYLSATTARETVFAQFKGYLLKNGWKELAREIPFGVATRLDPQPSGDSNWAFRGSEKLYPLKWPGAVPAWSLTPRARSLFRLMRETMQAEGHDPRYSNGASLWPYYVDYLLYQFNKKNINDLGVAVVLSRHFECWDLDQSPRDAVYELLRTWQKSQVAFSQDEQAAQSLQLEQAKEAIVLAKQLVTDPRKLGKRAKDGTYTPNLDEQGRPVVGKAYLNQAIAAYDERIRSAKSTVEAAKKTSKSVQSGGSKWGRDKKPKAMSSSSVAIVGGLLAVALAAGLVLAKKRKEKRKA